MTSERIIPSPDGWDVAESRHGPTDTVILSELFQQNVQISYFCITYSPSLSLFVVSSLHAGGRIPSIAQWTCSVCGRTLYFIWKSLHWWILNQTQNIRNASPFVLGIFILQFTLTGYDTVWHISYRSSIKRSSCVPTFLNIMHKNASALYKTFHV